MLEINRLNTRNHGLYELNLMALRGGEHRVEWITTYPFSVIDKKFDYIKGHPKTKGNVIIGNDVWIGMNAVIMSGVTIGDGAVIAAGSLVTKNIKPYEIVGGNPAKHIKFRFDQKVISKLLKLKWWDLSEKQLGEIIPLLLSEDVDKFIKTVSDMKEKNNG